MCPRRVNLLLLLIALLFPWAVSASAASSTLASYTWMADGAKYASARADGSGYVYKGALVFERNAAGKLSLDAALTTDGRITAQKEASTGAITGYTVHHHITDHLGSVRAVVDVAGNILETSDFLPYGTRWSQTGGSSSATITDATSRWRYSGKEEQAAALNPALPLIDYGARMYDPAIARWMSVDPLAEKYYPMGGYGYCAGSPICIVDPQGDTVKVYTETKGFGHAWISVREGDEMVVYSYGRYDGTTKGSRVSNGPGVLLKLSGAEAIEYNEKKSDSGYYSFTIPDVSDESVSDIMNSLFDSSNKLPSNDKKGYYNNPSAHVIDEYKLFSRNCTTTVSDVLNSAGSSVLKGTANQPTGSIGIYTYTSTPVTHTFVNPRSLQHHLKHNRNIPASYVKK